MPFEKIREIVGLGKPVIAWEVSRVSDRQKLAALGVRGFMAPQWAQTAGVLAPRKTTWFASGMRRAGENPATASHVEGMPTWAGGLLVMDQQYGTTYGLGQLVPEGVPEWSLDVSWQWTERPPTQASGHAGIAFGLASDEPFALGAQHAASTVGAYVLIQRGTGVWSLLAYPAGATSGESLGNLTGPAPRAGSSSSCQIKVTAEGLRVTVPDAGVLEAQDARFRGGFVHLARNHSLTTAGPVGYGDVTVTTK